jgi:hypothetical protein
VGREIKLQTIFSKLWNSGPNRHLQGKAFRKSIFVGFVAHAVLIFAWLMTDLLFDEFTGWKQEFCHTFAGFLFIPIFWAWHWIRNGGFHRSEILELGQRGPHALLLVLPLFWLFLLVQFITGGLSP